MPLIADLDTERLLRFNRQLLDQALALAAAHETPGAPPYACPVGAHLRHVIEHYEALLLPPAIGLADYDARARDAELERCPRLARRRLLALQTLVSGWPDLALDTPVRVRGQGGLAGDFSFTVSSTLGRELVFVASHAVHHFALLQAHCQRHGIHTGDTFGMAPGTVAHERGQALAPTHLIESEIA